MYRECVHHHRRNQRDTKATKTEKKTKEQNKYYSADTWRVSQSAGLVYIDQKRRFGSKIRSQNTSSRCGCRSSPSASKSIILAALER